ncbi:MAG: 30S ribosome-binding factor RbfA [Clostridia bacterium]|nr:30S ribosome-binding factor RbfA [Clostridia bacterium]
MKGQRGARLASEFQKEITSIISRDLRNKYPSISAIISVTGADVAPDLKTAKIYLSIFDTDEQKRQQSFEIIKENSGFIRHELSSRMTIRTVPVLTFIFDVSAEYGSHIDDILKNL